MVAVYWTFIVSHIRTFLLDRKLAKLNLHSNPNPSLSLLLFFLHYPRNRKERRLLFKSQSLVYIQLILLIAQTIDGAILPSSSSFSIRFYTIAKSVLLRSVLIIPFHSFSISAIANIILILYPIYPISYESLVMVLFFLLRLLPINLSGPIDPLKPSMLFLFVTLLQNRCSFVKLQRFCPSSLFVHP